MKFLFVFILFAAACSSGEGRSMVGMRQLGSTYTELKAMLGPFDMEIGNNHVIIAKYDALGLQIVFSSPQEVKATDDSIVMALIANANTPLDDRILPGKSRVEIEAMLGQATETVGSRVFYKAGYGIEYLAETASQVALFAQWEPRPDPPEMTPAE